MNIIKSDNKKSCFKFNNEKKVYIYGAGKYGIILYHMIKRTISVRSFVQTKINEEKEIEGVSVISLKELCSYNTEPIVILFAINDLNAKRKVLRLLKNTNLEYDFHDLTEYISYVIESIKKPSKSYKTNVAKRYDSEFEWYNNQIYSIRAPIGEYSNLTNMRILSHYIDLLKERVNKPISELKILDVGCGDGACLRLIAELIKSSDGLYGFDLSNKRVKVANSINPKINIICGDMVENFPEYSTRFDGIISFLSIMFLTTESELIAALSNIYNAISEKGLFLWYEPNQDNHFEFGKSESRGYSEKEMDKYALKVGFHKLYSYHMFKQFKLMNKTIDTLYLAQNKPLWFCEFLNGLYGKPLRNISIYYKK